MTHVASVRPVVHADGDLVEMGVFRALRVRRDLGLVLNNFRECSFVPIAEETLFLLATQFVFAVFDQRVPSLVKTPARRREDVDSRETTPVQPQKHVYQQDGFARRRGPTGYKTCW